MAGSTELATGYISLSVSTRGMGSQIAREFTGVEKGAAKSGKKAGAALSGGLLSSVKGAAGPIAAVFAGGAVLKGIKDTIGAAGDLEQSVGGVEVVFKGYAKSIKASSGRRLNIGASENAYNQLAATIGSTLKNKGIKDFGKQTENLIGLGADLASQFGGSTQEAVDALSSALRGETDPIERYGVGINQAAVQAEALAKGIAKGKGPLTAQQNAMATLSLITKQTADAQGNFARESDTLQGKQARAAAQFENLKAVIGNAFLPAASTAMGFISEKMIPAFEKLTVTLGPKITAAFGSVSKGFKAFAGFIQPAVTGITMFSNSLRTGFTEDEGTPIELVALRVRDVAKAVMDFATRAAPVVLAAFRSISAFIRAEVIPRFLSIVGAVRNLVAVVGPIIRQVVQTIVGAFRDNLPAIKTAVGTIKTIITGAMDLIKAVIDRVTKVIGLIWRHFGDNIMSVIKVAFKTIVGVIGGALKIIAGVIKLATAVFKGDWSGAWAAIKQIVKAAFEIIKTVVKGALGVLRALFGDILEKIRLKVVEKFNAIKTKITNAIGEARDLVKTILGAGKNGLQSIFSTAVTAIGTIWDGLKEKARTPIKFVVDTVLKNGLVAGFDAIAKLIPGVPTIGDKITWPTFATGGWTGPGSKYTPAGIVHADEFVINKESRRRIESQAPGYLDRLNGYASGGRVLPSAERTSRRIKPTRSGRTNPSYGGHSGIDFFGVTGDPIFAVTPGRISYTGSGRGYGSAVFEKDTSGLEMAYGHMSKILARVGDIVKAGQVIGKVGYSGNVRPKGPGGAHLHFEVAPNGFARAGNRASSFAYLGGAALAPADAPGAESGGSFFDFLGKLKEKFSGPLSDLKSLGDSPLGQLATGAVTKIKDGLLGKAKNFAGGALSGAVDAVKGTLGKAKILAVLTTALGMNKLPLSLLDNWYRQVMSESGGNAGITQQISDVNSRSGNRAQGLLQVIPPTFAAYRSKNLPNDPFNALANAYAAMNYAKHRYGNLEAVIGHGHGYYTGTSNAAPGMNFVGERGPELVMSKQLRRFRGGETVLNARDTAGALGGNHFYGDFHGPSAAEIADEIEKRQTRRAALRPIR